MNVDLDKFHFKIPVVTCNVIKKIYLIANLALNTRKLEKL